MRSRPLDSVWCPWTCYTRDTVTRAPTRSHCRWFRTSAWCPATHCVRIRHRAWKLRTVRRRNGRLWRISASLADPRSPSPSANRSLCAAHNDVCRGCETAGRNNSCRPCTSDLMGPQLLIFYARRSPRREYSGCTARLCRLSGSSRWLLVSSKLPSPWRSSWMNLAKRPPVSKTNDSTECYNRSRPGAVWQVHQYPWSFAERADTTDNRLLDAPAGDRKWRLRQRVSWYVT